jgi:hypothetical protein
MGSPGDGLLQTLIITGSTALTNIMLENGLKMFHVSLCIPNPPGTVLRNFIYGTPHHMRNEPCENSRFSIGIYSAIGGDFFLSLFVLLHMKSFVTIHPFCASGWYDWLMRQFKRVLKHNNSEIFSVILGLPWMESLRSGCFRQWPSLAVIPGGLV